VCVSYQETQDIATKGGGGTPAVRREPSRKNIRRGKRKRTRLRRRKTSVRDKNLTGHPTCREGSFTVIKQDCHLGEKRKECADEGVLGKETKL